MGKVVWFWLGCALAAYALKWSDLAFYSALIIAAIYSVGAEVLDRLPTNESTTRG